MKIKTWAFLFCLASLGAFAADETAEPVEETQEETIEVQETNEDKKSLSRHAVTATYGHGVEQYDNVSFVFDKKDMQPGIGLSYAFRLVRPKPERRVGFELTAHGGILHLRQSELPGLSNLGVTPAFSAGDWKLSLPLGISVQNGGIKAIYDNSPFDFFGGKIGLRVAYEHSRFQVGALGKILYIGEQELSDDEAKELKVDRNATYKAGAFVKLRALFGLWAEAQWEYFNIGRTAIATKQFGIGIPSDKVTRSTYSLSWIDSKWSARLSASRVNDLLDSVSIIYQHPWMDDDYLLSQWTAKGEFEWRF